MELKLEDFKPYEKFRPLAGNGISKTIRQKAWHLAGETQKYLLKSGFDFTQNKVSKTFQKHLTYLVPPPIELGQVFPCVLTQIMREGFVQFGKSMRSYMTNKAILHA